MLKALWRKLKCKHDYFIARTYADSYVDDSGYSYKVVVYTRYILECRECGKRKETSNPWQAHEKSRAERQAELKGRHERQMVNRRRVGIGK